MHTSYMPYRTQFSQTCSAFPLSLLCSSYILGLKTIDSHSLYLLKSYSFSRLTVNISSFLKFSMIPNIECNLPQQNLVLDLNFSNDMNTLLTHTSYFCKQFFKTVSHTRARILILFTDVWPTTRKQRLVYSKHSSVSDK